MQKPPVLDSLMRTSRFESFEDRLALTADSLANAASNLDEGLNHALELHSSLQVEEAGPQLEMHQVGLEAPALELHQVAGARPIEVHQVDVPGLELHEGVQELEMHNDQLNAIQDSNQRGDFRLEELTDIFLDAGDLDTALSSAHEATGVDYVHSTYGLDGSGQTVVIIDSGIAYDHDNLGGGLGNRVVGGWDFAENDADFYDDGPAGFHGTHVAGIVGSDHAVHTGVAPGADLVGLRVFDDDGAGYFSHVESALQWVHDNRFTFEHDITTVNLSLGTTWNSDTIPSWAMLEDEFQQLHEDGIFVSVSAGNSFSSYNTAGVSYPAASPFVVPVASVTDQGVFSSFSQRNERVLAAPGSSISSTVPGYLFGNSGNTSAFGTASGTSMAAPYVAGASVLVREAMEMAGYTNITQDTIYDHLRDTADIFYDSATDANYHNINMQSALDALLGDDGNSSAATAEHAGTLSDFLAIDSTIMTENDVDFFTFTAADDGTVTMYTEDGAGVDAYANVVGVSATGDDNVQTFDVAAGETYTIQVSSVQGTGQYSVGLQLAVAESSEPEDAVDLGRIDFDYISDQSVSNNWYQLRADHDAAITIEALFDSNAGVVDFDLYDAQMNLIGSTNSTGVAANSAIAGSLNRIDAQAAAGETYYIHATGDHSDVDFRITNLLAEGPNDNMLVHGTDGDDWFVLDARDQSIRINGVTYEAEPTDILAGTITVDAGAGNDAIVLHGTEGDDSLTLIGTSFEGSVGHAGVNGSSLEQITIDGHGGTDSVHFADTAGRDVFTANPLNASMTGSGYNNSVTNIEAISAASSGGTDKANFYDGQGTDHFGAGVDESWMTGQGYSVSATGFATNVAHSTAGGNDTAELLDSDGSDTFISRASYTMLAGNGFFNKIHGFSEITAQSTNGQDVAYIDDTHLNDTFHTTPDSASIINSLYEVTAEGFGVVVANSLNGGNDHAIFEDSDGSDSFVAASRSATMSGSNFTNIANGFGQVTAYASEGNDTAVFLDSNGDDTFVSHPDRSWMVGSDYFNLADGFDNVQAFAGHGTDKAYQYDSSGDDNFIAEGNNSWMTGAGYANSTSGFDIVEAFASQGHDTAKHFDTNGHDRFTADGNGSWMTGNGYFNRARGFDRDFAYSTRGGDDVATFKDSVGTDTFISKQSHSLMLGAGFYNKATGFAEIVALSTNGGDDAAYIHDSNLDDHVKSYSNNTKLSNSEYTSTAVNFASVTVAALNGGYDTAKMYDTLEDDIFRATPTSSSMTGEGYANTLNNFELVMAYASGGFDQATFRDGAGDDTFGAKPEWSWMTDGNYLNFAQNFDITYAFATEGNDQANFWGDENDEEYHAKSDFNWMVGSGYLNFARGFETTTADGVGGNDDAYLHDVDEEDTIFGRENFLSVSDNQFSRTIRNVDRIEAEAAEGAQASADIDAVDYLFDQLGTWI